VFDHIRAGFIDRHFDVKNIVVGQAGFAGRLRDKLGNLSQALKPARHRQALRLPHNRLP
jgi:hypothetical protein